MSYTKLLYHIVFRTKDSVMSIPELYEKELYGYIWGIVQNKKSTLYQIGGMPDHIHILLDFHPDLALSGFMRDLKACSSKWLSMNPHFPDFQGWGQSYAAFSYSMDDLNTVRNYIRNQKEHHKKVSFSDEFRNFVLKNGGEIDEFFLQK